jgi:hypothetical protein
MLTSSGLKSRCIIKSVNAGRKLRLTSSSDLKIGDFLRTARGYKPEDVYTYLPKLLVQPILMAIILKPIDLTPTRSPQDYAFGYILPNLRGRMRPDTHTKLYEDLYRRPSGLKSCLRYL